MSLEPDKSIMVGLATATLVYGIYQGALPNLADVRSLDARNKDISSSERTATWTAAGVVAGIGLLSSDMTVFTIGSVMVVGMAWMHRHANHVSPLTGKASGGVTVDQLIPPQTQQDAPAAYAQPMYDATVI